MLLVVALGLFAAFLFASAASLQQRATRVVPSDERSDAHAALGLAALLPVLTLVRSLVHSPLWLAGWGTNLGGFLTQAAALHLGSVALVQPLLVTQLLFTLPLATAWSHRRPLARDWLSAALICGGLALFLGVRGATPLEGDPRRVHVILAGLVTAGLVVLLLMIARGRRPAVHGALASVAAGLCFAMSAVLIKLTTEDLFDRGVVATAMDWPGYFLAVSTLVGLVIEQDAFAAGALPTAVAGMTITNPIASYFIGIFAFNVAAPTGFSALAAVAGTAILLFLGVLGLAHSPTVKREAECSPADTPSSRARDDTIRTATADQG